MKYKYLILGLVLVLGLAAFVAAKPPTQPVCPITQSTNVVVYADTTFGGVGSLSKSWITKFMDWWKTQDPGINYVILDSNDVKTDCNLANYPNIKIYIQPGGNAYTQQNALGSSGKNNINNYIDSGRGYVGICAGFYYTASDYYWQGDYYDWPDLLGKYQTVEGSIKSIADYDQNPGYALTSVGNGYNMIYYGGPTIGYEHTGSQYSGQALLTYNAIPNNLPAAIKYNNMLLMSVHAEAFENDGITGLTTEDRTANYIWFANAINSVARTAFYVPGVPNPPICGNNVCESGENWQNCSLDCIAPACADGIDNDADGLIDLNDNGCASLEDNSELNEPVAFFFDGFESGSLASWTLTTIENNWKISTLNPYQGSYYAEAKPMNTNVPASVMERAISTAGYSNIKLSYYRKLVGLDAADEFQAKWFDGVNWNVLESTGSSSANNAAYIYKEYALPSTASNNANFKIKFECTAGATSEYCRVDNVKLEAN
ncbi:MAG: BPL-N domain-containing protein [Candidatus Nanoarchaeia archaeon]